MARQEPHVNVIIPAFNAAKYVRMAVESVIKQEGVLTSVVIINDGSTDGTAEALEALRSAHGHQITIITQRNAGVAASRNTGFQQVESTAEFVMFLDADDELRNGALDSLVHQLTQQPEACAVFGQAAAIDADGKILNPLHRGERIIRKGWNVRMRSNTGSVTWEELLLFNCITTTGQVLLRRSTLPCGELFDSTLSPSEDWNLWFRLARNCMLFGIQDVTLNYRLHSLNTSKNGKRMRASGVRMRMKWATVLPPFLWGELLRACLIRAAWRCGRRGLAPEAASSAPNA